MMPERDVDPTVYRRRLRNVLRRRREALGITQAMAAQEMSWSVSKLIRIETGVVTISVNDLRALLAYYQITDPAEVEELLRMARSARKHSWLGEYKGVATDVFLTFLGHEDAAVASYNFQPVLVPGLLQTDEYATEVLQVTRGPKDPRRINGLVELRSARQERMVARADEIKLYYLLDESVVRRSVGGREVMRRQVSHLIDTCQQENVTLGVIPFKTGIYRSIRVPFVILDFSEPDDAAILYLEYPQGEELIREDGPLSEGGAPTTPAAPTIPPTYMQIFGELQLLTSEAETLQILQAAMRDL